jgi:hypothetical protein
MLKTMVGLMSIFQIFLINNIIPQTILCIDCDKDGLNDTLEQTLAERFAPIIYHDSLEEYLPTNVDVFLKETNLYIYDDNCSPDIKRLVIQKPSQQDLISQQFDYIFCGSAGLVKSNCTRSISKQRTYYLSDVANNLKIGSLDSKEWTTYFHCYKNIQKGITIQYWRFFASDVSHGGDWECVQVFLDSLLNPMFVDLLGHTDIYRRSWTSITAENNHPLIFSEKGGHTSVPYSHQAGIKQETWSGGKVNYLDGNISQTGLLMNVGEKLHPLNGQVFIQYSGLWGSPGIIYATSGYWCPPYNETGINEHTQFIKAWCNDMLDAENIIENGMMECFPCSTSR